MTVVPLAGSDYHNIIIGSKGGSTVPRVEDLDERIGALIVAKIDGLPITIQEFPVSRYFLKIGDNQIEHMIAIFEWRYQFWLLQFAERLSEDPNGGFAVLVLLNAYFDMIAQLNGHRRGDIEKGLELVFPELASEPDVRGDLEKNLRHAIAHMGITTDIILQEGYDYPLVWGPYRGNEAAIVINPRLMLIHIKSHFEEYVAALRDPDPKNDKRRRDFLKRVRRKA